MGPVFESTRKSLLEDLWDFCKYPDLDNVQNTKYFSLWDAEEKGIACNLSLDKDWQENSIRYWRKKYNTKNPPNLFYEFQFKNRCLYPVETKEKYLKMVSEYVKTPEDLFELQKALIEVGYN